MITEPIFHLHPQNLGIEPDSSIHVRDKYSDNGHGSSLRKLIPTLGCQLPSRKCHFAMERVPFCEEAPYHG